jgi:hypothetical protein
MAVRCDVSVIQSTNAPREEKGRTNLGFGVVGRDGEDDAQACLITFRRAVLRARARQTAKVAQRCARATRCQDALTPLLAPPICNGARQVTSCASDSTRSDDIAD